MRRNGTYVGRHMKKTKRIIGRVLMLGIILLGIIFAIYKLVEKITAPDVLVAVEPGIKVEYIGDIPVYEDFLPEEAAGRILQKREIKYIVIHETANTSVGADAAAHNAFIHSNGIVNEHSWHYTVDDEQIYHHIPDDEPAYHAGDHLEEGGGNLNGIGIEICVASDNDYEKTLDHAAQLSAKLLAEYGLNPQNALKTHCDFSGKQCPKIMLEEERWDIFFQKVEQYYLEYAE